LEVKNWKIFQKKNKIIFEIYKKNNFFYSKFFAFLHQNCCSFYAKLLLFLRQIFAVCTPNFKIKK